jgi:hypothetical protein
MMGINLKQMRLVQREIDERRLIVKRRKQAIYGAIAGIVLWAATFIVLGSWAYLGKYSHTDRGAVFAIPLIGSIFWPGMCVFFLADKIDGTYSSIQHANKGLREALYAQEDLLADDE